MNKSYSKIRHIQEANQRLEKRLLSEQMDGMEEFNQELQDVGETLSAEEIQELQPECSISYEVPEYSDEIKKFEDEVKKMTVPQIKNKIKELKAQQRSNKVQEQNYGGKKWDKMFICVGGKMCRGDYPPCKVPLTF